MSAHVFTGSQVRDPRRLLLVLLLIVSPAAMLLITWGWRGVMLEMAAGVVLLAFAVLTPGLAEPDRSIAIAGSGPLLFSGLTMLATLLAGMAAGRTATMLFAVGLFVLGTVLPWTAASRVYRSAGADTDGSPRTLAVFGLVLAPFLAALLAVGVGALIRMPSAVGVLLALLGAGGLTAVVVKAWQVTVLPRWVPRLALAAVLLSAAAAITGILLAPQALGAPDPATVGSWLTAIVVAAVVALPPLLTALPTAFAHPTPTAD